MSNLLNEFSIYDTKLMVQPIERPNKHYTKNIYFLLTNTKTFVGRAIIQVTGSEYNHVSLALTKDCKEVYAFGRNTEKGESGFVKEDLDKGLYKTNDVDYCIMELPVTDKEYNDIKKVLLDYKNNQDKYSFDKLGLILSGLNIPKNTENTFFCSGFIQDVLVKSNIHIFNKNYALVRPNDFMIHPNTKEISRGKLKELVRKNKLYSEGNNMNNFYYGENEDGEVILTEASKLTPSKRKEIEKNVYDVMSLLDKSGHNTEKYKKMFGAMNNQQFDNWMKKFLKDESLNFYLEIEPFKYEPSLSDIEKAAKYLNVPLDEYVYIPFQNPDGDPIRTAEKVPVGLKEVA